MMSGALVRASGAVRYTGRLHFGPKRLVYPQARRVKKDWELLEKT